ncbi:MAG TPA: TonB-dependent receptor [Gemmatimonadaceae bacterium]|nr:TonB-dependent receptor [Gemmatimonadaceae bacterium]
MGFVGSRKGWITLWLCWMTLTAAPALAQSILAGRVTDDTGGVLPGVSVSLRAADAGRVETVTDARGRYMIRVEQPGRYDVRFSLVNFSRFTRQMTLPAGQTLLDVVLPLALTADVVVTGRRTFRNLADVENPAESLVGLAGAASEGAVTAKQLEGRPLVRPGEVLETVPGLVISQHSGEGKANQYYLRGFNLDHGTDFSVSVAGIPVNMPTHGHGQGWSDVNFLIPELVSGVQFKKGPYYADEGDFSTAGAANITYVNALDRPLLRLTGGEDGFGRVLAAASPKVGSGHFLVALETGRANGPWETPEHYRRLNGVVRYSRGDTRQGFALTFMGYGASWTATDQVPERAISTGRLSRFGSFDKSDGGSTHRVTLSAEAQRSATASSTKVVGYAMDYGLDLFSNFTYLLNDPVNGDQFEQTDNRRVFGLLGSHRRRAQLLDRALEHKVGLQVRHDRIGPLGLYATRRHAGRSSRENCRRTPVPPGSTRPRTSGGHGPLASSPARCRPAS